MKSMTVTVGDQTLAVHALRTADDHLVVATPDGRRVVAAVTREGGRTWVTVAGRTVLVDDPRAGARRARDDHHGSLEAPMPGKVVKVLVVPGDVVEKGQVLLAVEAMKMEHALKAPRDGVIAEVSVREGAQVKEGEILVRLEPA